MQTQFKAIETVYNGYRFRSRLEARWAVFFDELGLDYEYEKEGFELPMGRYLPDFWIADWLAWVEIKPERKWDSAAWLKCVALARATGYPCLLLLGSPWPDEYFILKIPPFFSWEYPPIEGAYFGECRYCETKYLRGLANDTWEIIGQNYCIDHTSVPVDGFDALELQGAFDAARKARFEFGERG